MPQSPDNDVAAALAAAGLGTVGQDIRIGQPLDPQMPAAAGVALWVYALGGPAPEPYMGRDGAGHITAQFTATVVVRVRDVAGDAWQASRDLARQVLRALTFNPPAGYFDLRADVSEPLYLGPNDSNQEEWNVPLTIRWEE